MVEFSAIVGLTPGPGHGDCFVWQRSSGEVVAVDAGGSNSTGRYAGSFNPYILILSHDDNDHIRGAVALMDAAKPYLRELWVPAEWAILIEQIANTTQDTLLSDASGAVNVDRIGNLIARELTTNSPRPDGEKLLRDRVNVADKNLASWEVISADADKGFSIEEHGSKGEHWYGATSLDEIVNRVKSRAEVLIQILRTALSNSVRIRFFSIDLALSRTNKEWRREGSPGTATLANASETRRSLAVRIPAGLPYTYALTRLTVQNRRALCTLLWNDSNTPNGGIVVWSDTDGHWLDHSSPLGFDRVIRTLSASSAPHHASANSAHDRVWAEMRNAPKSLIMISAGGQKNQSYHPDYLALGHRRCCTWCRPRGTRYQEVSALSTLPGPMRLLSSCVTKH